MYQHYARADIYSLTAIAQSPTVLFVGWDTGTFGNDKLTGKIGGNVRAITKWLLRLSELGSGRVTDYDLITEHGKKYITNLRGGAIYRVSLLVEDAVREKHSVAACPPLQMPINEISTISAADAEISIADFIALFGGDIYHSGSGSGGR